MSFSLFSSKSDEDDIINMGNNIIKEMSIYLSTNISENLKNQLDLIEIIPEQDEKLIDALPTFNYNDTSINDLWKDDADEISPVQLQSINLLGSSLRISDKLDFEKFLNDETINNTSF